MKARPVLGEGLMEYQFTDVSFNSQIFLLVASSFWHRQMAMIEMLDLSFAVRFHLHSIVLPASDIYTFQIMNTIDDNYNYLPFSPWMQKQMLSSFPV